MVGSDVIEAGKGNEIIHRIPGNHSEPSMPKARNNIDGVSSLN